MHGVKLPDSIIDGTAATNGDPLVYYALVQRRTMQRQVRALQRYLVSAVERCLITIGYRLYALTRSQEHALCKLTRGSEPRFRCLHALCSDAAMLVAQGLTVATFIPHLEMR